MSEENLSASFWFHACSYATFLINRMPSKVLEMKSPYQVLFDKVPEIQNLKVFGTAVYPFLRPYNSNKLQARSVQCVFLGYAMRYNGVICYNVATRKILSRHTIHDESTFPCKIHSNSSINRDQQMQSPIHRPIVIQVPLPTVAVPQVPQRDSTSSYEHYVIYGVSISDTSVNSGMRSSSIVLASGTYHCHMIHHQLKNLIPSLLHLLVDHTCCLSIMIHNLR
ncbi:hypothetical protein ACFX15_029356 [Malus domestica]